MTDSVDQGQIEQLQQTLESLRLQAEIAELQAHVRTADVMARMVNLPEAWGDVVPREDGRWTEGLFRSNRRASTREDRKSGDNAPFWQTEYEHAVIRGISRLIGATSEVGIAALSNLANYILADGLTFTVSPKLDRQKQPIGGQRAQSIAWAVEDLLAQFVADNDLDGELDREWFNRSRRDGELFSRLAYRGGTSIECIDVEPDWITEPANPRAVEDYHGLYGLDWRYGVATDQHNTRRVHGYFVEFGGVPGEWEFVPADEMVSLKLNVDRMVKRGLSDYYPVYLTLERADKLLGNTMEGAAIQAAIAYIREHAPAVSNEQIESFVSRKKDFTYERNTPGGPKTERVETIRPGRVVDVGSGNKFHYGPLGSPSGPQFVDLVQAATRIVGIRWTMPEYMISGDASNGNFASTLVAEAPFTKYATAEQSRYRRLWKRVAWKVLKILHDHGRLPVATLDELRAIVEIDIDASDIAVRDRKEDHEIRTDLNDRGIVSDETLATEEGYDLVVEQGKGARRKPLPVDGPSLLGEAWRGYPF